MTLDGCDISVFQGAVNFDELAANTGFVICKATEGTGFTDATFRRNWREARRVGLPRGAYHFARPDLGNTALAEADWFLAEIGELLPGDLLALDYEAQWDGDVAGWCLAWLERVRAVSGFAPLLYLNLSLARGHDWTAVIASGYGLWLARYDGQPTTLPVTPWPVVAMKQWSSQAVLFGVPALVDVNVFFGDTAQLRKYGAPEKEARVDLPVLVGQSDDLVLKTGEVGTLTAIYQYPDGRHNIQRKVWSHKTGRFPEFIRPPVDPEADLTVHLDAEPAVFVVDVHD